MLHYLDMIDARMYDMSNTLEGVSTGWLLNNRKLYKYSPKQEEHEDVPF